MRILRSRHRRTLRLIWTIVPAPRPTPLRLVPWRTRGGSSLWLLAGTRRRLSLRPAALRPLPGRTCSRDLGRRRPARPPLDGQDVTAAPLRLEAAHEVIPLVVRPLPARSWHHRLQAIHALGERLGLPPDDPFLRWIASA